MSIPEAARLLSFSENHFRSFVLPSLPRIPGTRPRILVADLEAWADAYKVPAPSSMACPPDPFSLRLRAAAQRRLDRALKRPRLGRAAQGRADLDSDGT